MSNEVAVKRSSAVASDERNPWERYGASGRNVVGRYLKFKEGDFLAGESQAPVKLGTRLIADVANLEIGYVRWVDQKPDKQEMGLLSEGFIMPDRDDLGDNDTDLWARDERTGEPRDPWAQTNQLVLRPVDQPTDDDEAYTFTTSSKSGLRAIRELCKIYGKEVRARPGQLPIVELACGSYQHPDYGRMKTPKFTVVGWTDGSAPKAIANGGDTDDDLPF
jgi:hypothetical protein